MNDIHTLEGDGLQEHEALGFGAGKADEKEVQELRKSWRKKRIMRGKIWKAFKAFEGFNIKRGDAQAFAVFSWLLMNLKTGPVLSSHCEVMLKYSLLVIVIEPM